MWFLGDRVYRLCGYVEVWGGEGWVIVIGILLEWYGKGEG